jgi:hypothetical protein
MGVMPDGDYDSSGFEVRARRGIDQKTSSPPHYYGDTVRQLFLVAGIIMFITLPFLRERISSPVFLSVVAILVLTFFAGITSPRRKVVILADVCISLVGFAIFAHQAITKFERVLDLLFATNTILACIFLYTFYLSLRTFRNFDQIQAWRAANIDSAYEGEKRKRWGFFRGSTQARYPRNLPEKMPEEEVRKKRFLDNETG